MSSSIFFFNDTATTEIYTLSLHDALPISRPAPRSSQARARPHGVRTSDGTRSEEHTSELQSQSNLVCRLLLEKKKKYKISATLALKLQPHGISTDTALYANMSHCATLDVH